MIDDLQPFIIGAAISAIPTAIIVLGAKRNKRQAIRRLLLLIGFGVLGWLFAEYNVWDLLLP